MILENERERAALDAAKRNEGSDADDNEGD